MEQNANKPPKDSSKRRRIIIIVVIAFILLIAMLFYTFELSAPHRKSAIKIKQDSITIDTATIPLDTAAVVSDTTKKDSSGPPSPHKGTVDYPSDTASKDNGSRKFATLGYHYKPGMNIHETQEINVVLSASNIKSVIRDTIIKILEDEDPDRNLADTGTIAFKEHIPLYKFVTVELVALDSGIIVRKTPDAPRQPVDTVLGNKWSWTIYANSAEKAESKLMLIVYSEDPSHIEKRIIHIQIHVEANFIRLFINYLSEHPGDALFKIVVPLVSFFGGLFAGTRRKKEKDNEKTDG